MAKTTKPFYNSTIPSDWTSPDFGTVFSFLKSFSFSREQLSDEKTTAGIQNIHYGDIHATFENEILDFEIESRIPFVKDGLLSTEVISDVEFPLLKDGDLIIADASEDTVGVAECVELKNINGRKIISGLHTFAARDRNGKTAEGYRTYILNNPQVVRELRRIATGFSVFGVSKTNISKVKLPLPPNKEQEAIANLLSLMDTAININDSIVAKKELEKKWVIQQMLTGNKRLKGFGSEWIHTKLGNVADIIDGTHQTPKYVENGIPFFSVENVTSNDFQNTKYISEEEHALLTKKYKMESGDILMTRIGSIGDCKLIDWEVNASFYVSLALLKIKKGISSEFIYQYSKTEQFKKETISKSLQWAAPQKINLGQISEIKIFIPTDVTEQAAIAQVLRAADKEIQLLKTKTEKLKEQKKGLMQVLLTGKKRLTIK